MVLLHFPVKIKKNKRLDLVMPDNIKFQLKRDVYRNSLGLEYSKVHEKQSYTVINNKIVKLNN